ncbi:MAG TPA: hypothetical protein VFL96_10570 [Acidobacteriaceae bacterium]|nr:hypothetical protein [Acidobacteriaceae bacterium]
MFPWRALVEFMEPINQPLLLPLGKVPEARLPSQGVRLLLRRKLAMLLPPLWKAVAPPRRGTALPVIGPLLIAHVALVAAVFQVVIGPLLVTVLLVPGPLLAAHITLVATISLVVVRLLLLAAHVAAVILTHFALVLLTRGTHLATAAILKSPVRPVEITSAVTAVFTRLDSLMPTAPAISTALGPTKRGHRQQHAHYEHCQPPAGANRDFPCAHHRVS